jgi:hypothetical protein
MPQGNKPDAVRERIQILKRVAEQSLILLARELWEVYHNKLYLQWGFETYDDFVRTEVGYTKSYARQLRRIFKIFVLKCDKRPNDLLDLTPAKAQVLLPYVNRGNVDHWLKKARELDYGALVIDVQDYKVRTSPDSPAPTDSDVNLPSSPVNLAGSGVIPRTHGDRKPNSFKKRTFRMPDDADSLLDEALAEAERITKSHSDGFNLACIAQHFLAHRLTVEGRDDGRVRWFMANFEEIYGGHFIRIKDERAWEVLAKAVEDNPDLMDTSAKETPDVRSSDSDPEEEDSGAESPQLRPSG